MTCPLTISMATHTDYDGLFFSVMGLRIYQDLPPDTEFLILDNNPDSDAGRQAKHFAKSVPNMRIIDVTDKTSSFVKYRAFDEAKGDVILGLDCHVLLQPGFIKAMMDYWSKNDAPNMLTGPLWYDDLKHTSELIEPVWRGHDYGIWGNCKEADGRMPSEPFEIPAQGMGCFSFLKKYALKVSPHFSGFGGEEWYMAEKTRQQGGRVICHPDMKWNHRFDWPKRTFPVNLRDKIANYYVAFLELYGDLMHPKCVEMTKYWAKNVAAEDLKASLEEALRRLGIPFVP